MRTFGRIHNSFFQDPDITALSVLARHILAHLHAGPGSNWLGAMPTSPGFISDQIRVPYDDTSKAIRELEDCGLVRYDQNWNWMMVTGYLAEWPIENPNSAVAALKSFASIPPRVSFLPELARSLAEDPKVAGLATAEKAEHVDLLASVARIAEQEDKGFGRGSGNGSGRGSGNGSGRGSGNGSDRGSGSYWRLDIGDKRLDMGYGISEITQDPGSPKFLLPHNSPVPRSRKSGAAESLRWDPHEDMDGQEPRGTVIPFGDAPESTDDKNGPGAEQGQGDMQKAQDASVGSRVVELVDQGMDVIYPDGSQARSETLPVKVEEPAPIPVLTIPLAGKGKEHVISEADLAQWQEMFPGVDVVSELRRIRNWNLTNPRKRKTARGVANHIRSWLDRSQNSAANRQEPGKPTSRVNFETFAQANERYAKKSEDYTDWCLRNGEPFMIPGDPGYSDQRQRYESGADTYENQELHIGTG